MISAKELRNLLEGEPDDAIIMVEFGDYLKAAQTYLERTREHAPCRLIQSYLNFL